MTCDLDRCGCHDINGNPVASVEDAPVEAVMFKQGEWRLFWRGQLHSASWTSKGAAEAHGDRCERAGRLLP